MHLIYNKLTLEHTKAGDKKNMDFGIHIQKLQRLNSGHALTHYTHTRSQKHTI